MSAAALALLLLFAAANYAPEALAAALAQSERAWEYVLQGVQASVLWAWLGTHMVEPVARGACALGAWEAMQRPVFRLLWPMDRPPDTGDLTLGEAAFGLPMVWLNAAAALFVAFLAQEVQRAEASH